MQWIMDFLSYRLQKKCWLVTISLQYLNWFCAFPSSVTSTFFFFSFSALLTASTGTQPNCHLTKYREGTNLLPLLCKFLTSTLPNSQFVKCCNNACQELNVNETKEILMTFSNKHREFTTAVIICSK